MNLPIIFFDIESTGVSTSEDRIVQLAMIKLYDFNDDTLNITKKVLINPGIPIPAQATECHGITDDMVKDAPKFHQLARQIHTFIDGHDMAGYNSNFFDVPMLYAEFHRAGINWQHQHVNFIDACTIFKRKEERTLAAAVKFYLNRGHDEAHDALGDVRATIDILRQQLKQYPDLPISDNAALALYSNYDKPRFDLAGCFAKDDEGRWIFNFGKHKGKLAVPEKWYLENFMLKPTSGFLPDTKHIVHQILGK